ncbi:MAG: glycosyltransferase [Clostridiales bacterium]|jgi:glycosyltransferase involved in cell wall biosynthesis|nr:glycosyltransferase [Eubacteriales bacterium]MDH7567794.1 glycosyltransferase [Clostridiales bacterium]
MIIDIFIGTLCGRGGDRICVNIANGLVDAGHQVRLVLGHLQSPAYVELVDKRVKIINFNKKRVRYIIPSVIKYIFKQKPQVFFVVGVESAILFSFIRKIFFQRFKVIVRCLNALNAQTVTEESLNYSLLNHSAKFIFNKADCLIAQCKGMADELVRDYKVNKSKLVVINNPVGQVIIEKSDTTCGTIEKKNEILMVASLIKQKGIDYLLKAFRKTQDTFPDLKLRIIGRGELENEIKEEIRLLKLEGQVFMDGFREDVYNAYAQAKVTVLSSIYEGFPNVLLESITMGTPVVAFDCPTGPSEIIIDDVNGYLAKYLDVDDLAEKIIKALNKNWDISAIKKTAEKYRPENIIPQYIEVIKKVCE